MTQTPIIFISAVTSELGSYRQAAEAFLRACGYQTVHQEMFGLTDATIETLLESHLRQCDAAVFLIGKRYGAEPSVPFERYGRMSYTQFEYHEATRMGIPTFLLMTDDNAPPAPDQPDERLTAPQSSEVLELQAAYRQRTITDRDWRPFSNPDQLRSELATMKFPWLPERAGLGTSLGELAMRREERREQLADVYDVVKDRLSQDLPQYAQVYLAEHWHEAERQAIDQTQSLIAEPKPIPKPIAKAYLLAGLSAARRGRLMMASDYLNDATPWVQQSGSGKIAARIDAAKGQVLFQLGRYGQACEVLERVVAVGEDLFGPTDATLLSAKANLAAALNMLGKAKEAEPIFEAVLEVRRCVLGPEHPRTINANCNLISSLTLQERYDEAEDAFIELRRLCKQVLGPFHRTTLHLTVELAHCLAEQSLPDESIDEYRTALAGYERVYGADAEQTARVLNDMAWVMHEAGDDRQAEPYAVRALHILRPLGRKNPETLNARHTCATIKAELGDWQRACRDFKSLIRDQGKVLGPSHTDTLTSRLDLASILIRESDDLEEACDQLEAARFDGQPLGETSPIIKRATALADRLRHAQGAAKTNQEAKP